MRIPENGLDHSGVFKLVPKWDKFINVLEDYVENKDICWIKWTTFNFIRMSHKVFLNKGILKIFSTLLKKIKNCGVVL
jgi:hypothetical protein